MYIYIYVCVCVYRSISLYLCLSICLHTIYTERDIQCDFNLLKI